MINFSPLDAGDVQCMVSEQTNDEEWTSAEFIPKILRDVAGKLIHAILNVDTW